MHKFWLWATGDMWFRNDVSDRMMAFIVLGLMAGGVVQGALYFIAGLFITPVLGWAAVFTIPAYAFMVGWGDLFSPTRNMNYRRAGLAEQYWGLSKKDRALFGKNYIKTLKATDIGYEQNQILLDTSTRIFAELNERKRLLAKAEPEKIRDISTMLENLQREADGLRIDNGVYREYL